MRQHLKLGRKPTKHDPRTLKLHDYTARLQPAPAVWDQMTACTPKWGMMLNDQIGDCTIAAVGHLGQFWTSQTGVELTASDDVILKAYEIIGGYDPAQPNTDQGCYMLDVLNYWHKLGLFGRYIQAFAAIDPTNRQQVMNAIYYFGGIYAGLNLPLSVQHQPGEWVKVHGPTSLPGSWGGHCMAIGSYSFAPAPDKHTVVPRTLTGITWGEEQLMSWDWFANYCDEAYVAISIDWLKDGKTPEGLDLDTLARDLVAIKNA